MKSLKGGTGMTTYPVETNTCTVENFTKYQCDIPTVGHDDGEFCLSKTDWGWCWCYGQ